MIQPCEYCRKPFDTRGMLSHVHFNHARNGLVSHHFMMEPAVWGFLWAHEGFTPPDVSRRALPAPTPGTRYGVKRKMLRGKALRWV